MLPLCSASHTELLLRAAEAFFGARLYIGLDAARAARLVCNRLGVCKNAAELQLQVAKIVAGALLSAPQAEVKGLAEALAATIDVAAAGGGAFDWAPELRPVAQSLLRDWVPQSSAKSVARLLQEIRTGPLVSADVGRDFAQGALEKAADLRHDLAALGLSSNPGVSTSAKSLYTRKVGYWQKPTVVPTVVPKVPDVEQREEESQELRESFANGLQKRPHQWFL